MMEMEELERRKKVERYKEDMIKQIAVNTGRSAKVLRAMNRRVYAPSTASVLTDDSRTDFDYQMAELICMSKRMSNNRCMTVVLI